MLIVTAADLAYVPGVIALYNSFKQYMSEHEFVCMVHDLETLGKLNNLGIPNKYIDREKIPIELPTSHLWPEESMAMYSRLLVPMLFDSKESMWIDADSIILKTLPEVDLKGFPCAGVCASSPTIGDQVYDLKIEAIRKIPAMQTGTIIFNRKQWLEDRIFDKCLINSQYNYNFVYAVQSLLNLSLLGKFLPLHKSWDTFATWEDITHEPYILHYAGYNQLPWVDKNMPYVKYWSQAYNKGIINDQTNLSLSTWIQ